MMLTAGRSLLVSVALSMAACGGGQTNGTPPPTVPATETSSPPPYRIFVTNESSGDLTVIDGGTNRVAATLPLGKRPRGIKVSPDGTKLYVALSGSPLAPPGVDESTLPPADKKADGIGVVDIPTLKALTVLQGGSDPEQVAVTGDGARLVVANEDTGLASLLDIASGKILSTFPVGESPKG
jgi:YVTN family beta-propeller protein